MTEILVGPNSTSINRARATFIGAGASANCRPDKISLKFGDHRRKSNVTGLPQRSRKMDTVPDQDNDGCRVVVNIRQLSLSISASFFLYL